MRTVLFSLALSLSACTPTVGEPVRQYEDTVDNKALLGAVQPAGPEYNFQVAIFSAQGNLLCNGVALSDSWVLTEQSCMVFQDETVRVGTGSQNLSAMIQLPVDEVLHSDESLAFGAGGVSLLHIATGNLTDWGRAAVLADISTRSVLAGPGTYGSVSGWGPSEAGGESSDGLQRVEMPLLDDSVCESFIEGEEWFCAGHIGFESEDACEDYGAPITVEHEFQRVVLGLNYGSDCTGVVEPASFIDVSRFLPWIVENVPETQIADTPAPAPDDHGDTVDDATELEQTVSFSTSGVLTPDDTDAFAFQVVTAQQVRLNTESEIDTIGTLLDAAGNVVGTNDDDGGDLDFGLDLWLEPGRYTLQVQGYGGRQDGPYTLSIEGDPAVAQCLDDDASENDTPETAWTGLDSEASVVTTGSPDYYRITVGAGELVTLASSTGNAYVYAQQLDGTALDNAWNFVGTASPFPVSDEDQDYLVNVYTDNQCEPYSYELYRGDCSLADDEPVENDTITDNMFLLGVSLTDNVLSSGDTDIWQIATVQNGQEAVATMNFEEGRGEPILELVDTNGDSLEADISYIGDTITARWTNDRVDALRVYVRTTNESGNPCATVFDLSADINNL